MFYPIFSDFDSQLGDPFRWRTEVTASVSSSGYGNFLPFPLLSRTWWVGDTQMKFSTSKQRTIFEKADRKCSLKKKIQMSNHWKWKLTENVKVIPTYPIVIIMKKTSEYFIIYKNFGLNKPTQHFDTYNEFCTLNWILRVLSNSSKIGSDLRNFNFGGHFIVHRTISLLFITNFTIIPSKWLEFDLRKSSINQHIFYKKVVWSFDSDVRISKPDRNRQSVQYL